MRNRVFERARSAAGAGSDHPFLAPFRNFAFADQSDRIADQSDRIAALSMSARSRAADTRAAPAASISPASLAAWSLVLTAEAAASRHRSCSSRVAQAFGAAGGRACDDRHESMPTLLVSTKRPGVRFAVSSDTRIAPSAESPAMVIASLRAEAVPPRWSRQRIARRPCFSSSQWKR